MTGYHVVAQMAESTVAAEYKPLERQETAYQSEAEMETELIALLQEQGYECPSLPDEAALLDNLRRQLEKLNNYTFTQDEWERFKDQKLCNRNEGIQEKTRKLQQDHVQVLTRDDGSSKNISLVDKRNIHNNHLQVVHQYEAVGGTYAARYDVTILMNGLPVVHIELKRRGVAIREAFNQIKRYQRDSFWEQSGLYEYVQLFVISNGTHTKYYSNTTRDSHVKEHSEAQRKKSKKTSNSFEFTSFWADGANRVIPDLRDFARTFFSRNTLLNILTRYCVFTAENQLMVMRPYQIAATERILNRTQVAHNYRRQGSLEAGGYVWHTTGSGKTLTSFKTAQLATGLPFIDKVLFVVDRKDLDYQTMKEYERFQKGAANSNTSTAVLKRQLEDPDARIIITTIQKLERFISQQAQHPVYQQQVVIIFDECHRSQFGQMHGRIIKAFKRYYLYGFTGTPIFARNAASGGNPHRRTTGQAFGEQLHSYTIVDAINDGNVLPFRIDYINTVREKGGIPDKQVAAIDRERALMAPERVSEVVRYTLEHFDQKTKRNQRYSLQGKRLNGFNAIFAAASIPMARLYYSEFRRQLALQGRKLRLALIYSYSPNEEDPEDGLLEETFEPDALDQPSRDFLQGAIMDYNADFKTNFDTSSEKFQNYYKDLSDRVKRREVDLLIVVNMFLTGFDATTLNTLWVDKNLKLHGLIQAFSRTNRILNTVKTFGNIVCFRDLQKETDEAIALFGDKEAGGVVLLKDFDSYYLGYEDKGQHHPGYVPRVEELLESYPLGVPIVGEQNEKEFIRQFGAILRLRNILTAFDEFEGRDVLPPRDLQDYQSVYIDLYHKLSSRDEVEKEIINEDLVFELELVRQVEVNIDYILLMVQKYKDGNCKDKSILGDIDRAIGASLQLRSKKELILGFIESVNVQTDVQKDWRKFVRERKEEDLGQLIEEEKLKPEETRRYIENAFRDGALRTTGPDLDTIMPPVSWFDGGRVEKKKTLMEKLAAFFEKYLGLV
ncbi:MAG: type I restriction endonuclease subunit R [Eubacteriales bacterium]|nr:type I restriction endonuclease subunit R [Eubacteriales bacterium]